MKYLKYLCLALLLCASLFSCKKEVVEPTLTYTSILDQPMLDVRFPLKDTLEEKMFYFMVSHNKIGTVEVDNTSNCSIPPTGTFEPVIQCVRHCDDSRRQYDCRLTVRYSEGRFGPILIDETNEDEYHLSFSKDTLIVLQLDQNSSYRRTKKYRKLPINWPLR